MSLLVNVYSIVPSLDPGRCELPVVFISAHTPKMRVGCSWDVNEPMDDGFTAVDMIEENPKARLNCWMSEIPI